jgi:hypothetical protein
VARRSPFIVIVLVLVLVLELWERVHPVGLSFSRIATVFCLTSKIEDEDEHEDDYDTGAVALLGNRRRRCQTVETLDSINDH